jgi:hypothetical protein
MAEVVRNGAYSINSFEIDETRGENKFTDCDSFREEFVKKRQKNILKFQLNMTAQYLQFFKKAVNA